MVVNATGVRAESGAQTYQAVHVDGAAALARAAKAAGVEAYVHVSGIGADPRSASAYIASKGLGETATLEGFPAAVILRPSVVFGPEDDFFNRFGALSRFMPVIPLFGGGTTRLQPVYAGDVARAAAAALDGTAKRGTIYELGGPKVMTLREAAELVLRTVERRRLLVGLPLGLSRLIASTSTFASKATLGLYPEALDDEPRSGRPSGRGQCRVGGGGGGGPDLARARHRAAGRRCDHSDLSCALPQDRPV